MMMRALIFLGAICFSTTAFAQSSPPIKKPALAQAAPKEPMGCRLVGTVKGTKLWAGDCAAASELRGTMPSAEPAAPQRLTWDLMRPQRSSKIGPHRFSCYGQQILRLRRSNEVGAPVA